MDFSKPSILIVDDEYWSHEIMEAFFEGRYNILRARGGDEAIEKAATERPDLIMLDIVMPGRDGFEVCRSLKENDATRFIPVVIVTSLGQKKDRLLAIEAGADDFLSKPVDKAELLARTASLLRLKDYHDERERAYSNLRKITAYFNEIITGFDPLSFSLSDAYDSIFSIILRKRGSEAGQPTHAVVISLGGRECKLFFRERNGFLKKRRVMLRYGTEALTALIEMKGDAYQNFPEARSDFLPPEIHAETGAVADYTSCCSNGTFILCLNYGRAVGAFDLDVLKDLAMHSTFLDTLAAQVKENDGALYYTIKALARAAEANDEDTGNHIIRVKEYSYELAGELGLTRKFCDEVRYSAQMHDVGKIHTPPEILRKPGKLAPEEWEEVKRHTVYGVKILGGSPRLEVARQIALNHHERWDGTGYPRGLKGEEIPLSARIVAISDVYDALRNKRVYKPGFDHETAMRIIADGDGRTSPGHFDPEVLALFKRISNRFREIYLEFNDAEPRKEADPEAGREGKYREWKSPEGRIASGTAALRNLQ